MQRQGPRGVESARYVPRAGPMVFLVLTAHRYSFSWMSRSFTVEESVSSVSSSSAISRISGMTSYLASTLLILSLFISNLSGETSVLDLVLNARVCP